MAWHFFLNDNVCATEKYFFQIYFDKAKGIACACAPISILSHILFKRNLFAYQSRLLSIGITAKLAGQNNQVACN